MTTFTDTPADTPEIAAIRELLASWDRGGDPQLVAAINTMRALLAAHDARESVPSVEVRIAVAMGPAGEWNGAGWDTDDWEEVVRQAKDGLDMECEGVRIITARVPLPQSMEIKGRVEP